MELALEEWIILAGVIGPFVTAVAAKISTPDWWKGLLSFSFAALVGFVHEATGGSFDLEMALSDSAAIWSTHLITWLGISGSAVARLHEYTATKGLPVPSFVSRWRSG